MTTRSAVSSGDIFVKNSSNRPKQIHSAWERSWTVSINSDGQNLHISEVSLLAGGNWKTKLPLVNKLLLLPLQGSLILNSGQSLTVGEVFASNKDIGSDWELSNPSSDTVHFVLIRMNGPFNLASRIYPLDFYLGWVGIRVSEYELENEFHPNLTLHIGQLAGRQETTLKLNAPSLAMVLGGAFEYVNRLMEQGDGVWLDSPAHVEIEALSTEGLILILEVECDSRQSDDFS
ncbi:MAG: hypothetical protein MUE75_02760 [Algoriphagus sp.]|nr:hypothetical protein [Algoriphagus sp.]